jgi:flagellar basal body rod protein FlgG
VTSNGDAVLGQNGPITFQNTDHAINISLSGIITVQEGNSTVDSQRGTLQLASFANPQVLQKDGASTFMAPANVAPSPPPAGTNVMQGEIEKSNVNGVAEMARLIQITRSYSDIANILSQEGDLRKNALAQLSQTPTTS